MSSLSASMCTRLRWRSGSALRRNQHISAQRGAPHHGRGRALVRPCGGGTAVRYLGRSGLALSPRLLHDGQAHAKCLQAATCVRSHLISVQRATCRSTSRHAMRAGRYVHSGMSCTCTGPSWTKPCSFCIMPTPSAHSDWAPLHPRAAQAPGWRVQRHARQGGRVAGHPGDGLPERQGAAVFCGPEEVEGAAVFLMNTKRL